jgi:hypothetical protein
MMLEHPLTARRIAAITAALQAGPLCAHDLAPKIFLCYGHAWRYLKFMHQQHLVYIAKWTLRRAGNESHVACYRLGSRKDASRPAAMTDAQKQAAYKVRLRADEDRHELARAKDRARKRKVVRDPLVMAMFGAPAARGDAHA